MVVEELVANVGFKVQGLGELRQFEDALKSVANLAKGLSGESGSGGSDSGFAGLSQKLQKIGSALDKFDVSAITGFAGRVRNDITTIKSASASWAGIGNIAGQIVQRFGPGVAAVTQLVTELTQAGTEAATLRSRLQISAQGKGTSAAQLDALSRTYESMGLTAADAEKQFGSFSKELNDSLDKGQTPDFLLNLGINPREGNRRRDTAEVMTETLSALADRLAKNQEASRQTQSGEERQKLAGERDQLLGLVRTKFGDETLGIMEKGGGAAAWENAKKEGVARRQLRTPEDEAQAERVRQAATQLQQKLALFADTWERLEMTVADTLLPPLNFVLDKVTALAKTLGLVRKTPEELRAEEEVRRNKQKRLEQVNELGSDYTATVEAAKKIGDSEVGAEQAKSVVGLAGYIAELKRNYASLRSPESRANIQKKIEEALPRLATAADNLQSVRPDIRGVSQDTSGKKAEVTNSDFGNDQRTFTIPIHVTGFTKEDVAIIVKKAVLEAVAMGKGSNGQTAYGPG